MQQKPVNKGSKFITGAVIIVIMVLLFKMCDGDTKKVAAPDSASTSDTNYRNQGLTVPEGKEIMNWIYSEENDAMTDKVAYFAECTSTNKLDFEFPYDGGSTLTVTIRKSGGKNEVILTLSKGQFTSPYNSTINLKFDDGAISKYGFSDAADGSSNYIFLNSANQIIQKMKTANHLKIEATYYQGGRQVSEFNVAGLNWVH